MKDAVGDLLKKTSGVVFDYVYARCCCLSHATFPLLIYHTAPLVRRTDSSIQILFHLIL